VIQGDEECDDGDESDTDECRDDCTLHVCGDGFLADAEECDDGELNSEDPDASCRTDCLFTRCGDGVLDSGETCDDGNEIERDECLTTCEYAECGDGFVHSFLGEECDDANEIDDDECRNDCTYGPTHIPSGCSEMATWEYEIAPDLWICSFNSERGKTWEQTWGVCNEEGGYYLPSVGPMTRRGLPGDDQIGPAMIAAAANGHDYITSGHPARSCNWEDSNYESCNGLGYVNTSETTGTGSNWVALTDGNEGGLRSWPAANTTGAHPLGSFCLSAVADPSSTVFDHRWR
jgi:cysteine-rich repeat protein